MPVTLDDGVPIWLPTLVELDEPVPVELDDGEPVWLPVLVKLDEAVPVVLATAAVPVVLAVASGKAVSEGLDDGRPIAEDVLLPEGDTKLFTTSTTSPFPLLMPTLGM